jgi:hypothetical protein
MSKHTPGPWAYQEKADAYTHIVRGPNDSFICQTPQGACGTCEANARLMAAAPDLLEALKGALLALESGVGDPEWGARVLACAAAIAKAEGAA